MREAIMLLAALGMAGCAVQPNSPHLAPVVVPLPPVPAASPTKLVETRYEIRGYREPAAPSIRHEAHAVFRQTRVPASFSGEQETVPRTSVTQVSMVQLPASEELTAELATQKKITADIIAMQTSIAEIQQRMRAEYGQLVRQSADVLNLKKQLDSERRLSKASIPPENARPTPVATTQDGNSVKW